MRVTAAAAGVLLVALAGCSRPVPLHTWSGPDEAIETLRQRAASVRTLQSSARVILERPDGDTVHLDAALVAAFPDRLRLRAWKLGHPVFDLTWTPEGLWVLTSHDAEPGEPAQASVTAAGFARAWALFGPDFFSPAQAKMQTPSEGPTLTIERHPDASNPGVTVLCEVDRATLTPLRYTVPGDSGAPASTLTLEHYRSFDGIIWPTRIEARSGTGSVVVLTDSPRFNEDVASGAFTPPAGAVKQP